MHICFITSEYPKDGFPHGGIGTFVQTISQDLSANGIKVTVLGINNYTKIYEEERQDGIQIFRLRPRLLKGLTWFLNYRSINKKLKEIHDRDPISVVEAAELGLAFIKKIRAIKYIIRLHGGHHFFAEAERRKVSIWKGYQERRSFKKADAFIAVSNYVKQHTNKFLSYHGKPISTIRNSVDLDIFSPRKSNPILKRTIVFAGTVCEKKGIHKLIESMAVVHNQFPDAELYIFGRDWHFPNGESYINYLKSNIITLPGILSDKIHFEGVVTLSVISEKFARAKVCVFPSLMETQGLVVTEAMAMEKLVVFSEYGPGKELIEHRHTGLLCNPYDSKSIADQIIWAFNNEEEGYRIGKNARAFVLSKFDSDVLLNANVNFYKSVIKL